MYQLLDAEIRINDNIRLNAEFAEQIIAFREKRYLQQHVNDCKVAISIKWRQ